MILGQRIRLWALERFDVSQNYHWANDPELIYLTGMNPNPKSLVDIERWFDNVCNNNNQRMFTIKTQDGEYLGNIEIGDIDWRVGRGEIGLLVGERRFWNQGYGSEAIELMVNFAFEELRLHRIEARVLTHNTRAQRVFEKCGFVREGILRGSHFVAGKHLDVVVYSLLGTDERPQTQAAAATLLETETEAAPA
ncbi:MAG: GNAT family N-acetyltransferase [Armatimonadetes bacterium]|nr:GNAT family N-acetyltransferase [Armatimonadota bacterium]